MQAGTPDNSPSATERPSLLLVTAGPPRPLATGRHRRTWELLQAAADHYTVDLACLSEAHVTLDQWRELAALSRRVILAPAVAPISVRQSLPVTGTGPLAMQRWQRALTALTRELAASAADHYDVIWCTDANLMDAAAHLASRHRVLDLCDSWCVNSHRLSRRQRQPRRLFTRKAAMIHHRIERQAARKSTLTIVADRRTAHRLKHDARVRVCPGGLGELIARSHHGAPGSTAPAAITDARIVVTATGTPAKTRHTASAA